MEALSTRRVAVVLFDGFTVLDVYGPVQAFAASTLRREDGSFHRHFQVVTVAQEAGPVKSGEGPTTIADYSFDNLGPVDILLIPGGMGTRKSVDDPALIDQIKHASGNSEMTTTVCTGTALLARTGLLDGRPATTNKMAWEWVKSQGPEVDWKRIARWVDDGNIVTSSGVSAGIDMALALVARLHDRETAERAARVMEYVWNDNPDNDPFA
jgi:transcriptional regulator GlxA family with amidase domain